ncbi:MAG: methyl-accepting chemotaxis protein [Blautia sp.]|nr:methyl-accepting chemotaxis protein [Blautia sp.]
MKNHRGKRSGSIMQTLLAGFFVPVILIIVLGVVCYNTASSGIMSKYRTSAVSTVSAVGSYGDLMCRAVSNKALELVTNGSVGDYYSKYYKRNDSQSAESYREAAALLRNALATNSTMYSCSVIPAGGSYATTLSGTMSDNPGEDFFASPEGAFFAADAGAQNQWCGYHTYLDENLNSDPSKYGLAFFQRISHGDSVLVMDISMDAIRDMLEQMDFGEGSIRAVISPDGRETALRQGEEELLADTWFSGESFYEETKDAPEPGYRNVTIGGESYLYVYSSMGAKGVMVCALIPKNHLLSQVMTIKYVTIAIVILAVIASLLIGMYISAGISRTVRSMTAGLSRVAEGDFSASFHTKRRDEFQTLTQSLNSMLQSMRELMRNMKQFSSKVNDMAGNVQTKTLTVNDSIEHVSTAMGEVSKGVQSQAQDTEKSNEKMIDFSGSINMVTDRTSDMGSVADRAIDAVGQGKAIVEELNRKSNHTVELTANLVDDIRAVQENSQEITNFVAIISSIADQTNLLSLNASIEAARAGEAGRGFSVVAEEIRKLADQSNESASQIQHIVEHIVATTDQTTASAQKTEAMVNEQARALEQTSEVFTLIQESVGELVEDIKSITDHLTQILAEKDVVEASIMNISAASEEVAASTEEVNTSMGAQVSAVQSLKQEAELLSRDAEELNAAMERFRIEN